MKRLSEVQVQLVVQRSRALSDATRVRILDILTRSPQPVGQIAAALRSEPSLISKHLQVLHHAKLVDRRREASTVIYRVVSSDVLACCRYLASADLTAQAVGAVAES
jgi:ArsR family transcriptional regulator, lead/cadmium/zinc/bismuth-responsive transcriptional repressor